MQSLFVMVHLTYLQPFIDVNKWVSTVETNILLVKINLNPLTFVDVPRKDYIKATLGVYELAHVNLLRDVFA